MKKLFALILAVVMVLGMVACAQTPGTNKPNNNRPNTDNPGSTGNEDFSFPLKEEVTLKMATGYGSLVSNLNRALAANTLWQDLYEMTNVKIEIVDCSSIETLNGLMQMGSYGDIICLNGMGGMNESVISQLIATGKLMPLNDYMTDSNIMPNFHNRVLAENPEILGTLTSPDGNIYTFGSHDADMSGYLESSIWINKAWLDKANLGFDVPTTLEELEKFFDWIMKNDPNGDGDPDEVPYACYPMGGSMIEALLGMWGIPTKDGVNDNYVYMEDGEVLFGPQQEAYKDFLKTMRKWMEKGWMYQDYILGCSDEDLRIYENYMNELIRDNGNPVRVGMWTGTGAPARSQVTDKEGNVSNGDYVSILPPTVKGYETRWYFHPGYMGTKGVAAISANCEHPEVACRWLDLFYDGDISERKQYAEDNSEFKFIDAEGKVSRAKIKKEREEQLIEVPGQFPLGMIFTGLPSAITQDDLENRYAITDAVVAQRAAFELYKDVRNKEVWPRPYFTEDGAEALSECRGDVMLLVERFRGEAIMGEINIDSKWQSFQDDLEDAGLEDMLYYMQEAYDVWAEGMES